MAVASLQAPWARWLELNERQRALSQVWEWYQIRGAERRAGLQMDHRGWRNRCQEPPTAQPAQALSPARG